MNQLSEQTYKQSIRLVRALRQLAKKLGPAQLDTHLENLTVTQLRILSALKEQPDIAAPDLVAELGLTPDAVTSALKPMVRDGLVRIRPDDADASIPRFSLGTQGQRAAYNAEAVQIVSAAALLGSLDNDEGGRAVEALERLLDVRPARPPHP